MAKVRDFDAELKALGERAKILKQRKTRQFGELVHATGAEALAPDILVGAMLDAVATQNKAVTADWSRRGAEFFRSRERSRPGRNHSNGTSSASSGATAQPDRTGPGTVR